MFGGPAEIPDAKREKLCKALTLLDGYIGSDNGYVAGEHITIADHSIMATVSSMVVSNENFQDYLKHQR